MPNERRRPDWALVALFVAILAVGWSDDHASCARHNVLVPEVNAISRYAADASIARAASARLEARSNPAQAVIDRTAAARFLKESSAIHARTLDCSGPLPATHEPANP